MPEKAPRPMVGLSPRAVGLIFCASAAFNYTASNACMRKLSGLHVADSLAILGRESVATLVLGLILIGALAAGRRLLPPWHVTAEVVLVAIAVQVLANPGVQWAMGVLGLAINIPVNMGASLVTSGLLGLLVLGEPVNGRTLGAMGILIAAIVALGMSTAGAGTQEAIGPLAATAATAPRYETLASIAASDAVAPTPRNAHPLQSSISDAERGAGSSFLVSPRCLLALVLTVFGGAIYTLLGLTLRRHATDVSSALVVMFLVTATGTISLGIWNAVEASFHRFASVPPPPWPWLFLAGATNLLGFVSITVGLRLVPLVHAYVLNASQVALAALAGVFFFAEPRSYGLIVGVSLTVLGIIAIGTSRGPAAKVVIGDEVAILPQEEVPAAAESAA